ncbi:MAG: hypothetical protein RBT45_03690 [Acholeplasmataceae bacterium]|nr:hypothetical protein [Acholeplasmataceae bacterium]
MFAKKYVPIIIILMLLTALGFTSSAAFAYWQDVSKVGNVVIRFGSPDANLEYEIVHDEFEGELVPEGYVFYEGETDSIVFEYDVWLDRTLVQIMDLSVIASDLKIGDSTEYNHLIDITINGSQMSYSGELFNDRVRVQVTVRLNEPIDLEEATNRGLDLSLVNVEDSQQAFEDIKGETISFKISFSVSPRVEN